jgi:hypothetical protein
LRRHGLAQTASAFVCHTLSPHPASLRSATLPIKGRDWCLSYSPYPVALPIAS